MCSDVSPWPWPCNRLALALERFGLGQKFEAIILGIHSSHVTSGNSSDFPDPRSSNAMYHCKAVNLITLFVKRFDRFLKRLSRPITTPSAIFSVVFVSGRNSVVFTQKNVC